MVLLRSFKWLQAAELFGLDDLISWKENSVALLIVHEHIRMNTIIKEIMESTDLVAFVDMSFKQDS